MIMVPFPNMVLNSHNVPGEEYQMVFTWKVPKSTSVSQMVNKIKTNAQTTKSMWGVGLETVIFNAHGEPGKIKIGQGITRENIKRFRKLRGFVKRIWLVSCETALIKKAGSITDGNYFCYRLAQESGAYVTASSAVQYTYPDLYVLDFIPCGFIDNWEGTVYTWNPKGELC